MMGGRRYLPLFDGDGNWIDRPDLYLLARMAYADRDGDEVVAQLHETMRSAHNLREALNPFEADISDRHVARHKRPRALAGSVVLELGRIVATPGVRPSIKAAIQLVAIGQKEFDRKRAQLASIVREVEKGFSDYRNTAHLQAAAIRARPSLETIECSEPGTIRFLSQARGFEMLLDEWLSEGRTKWHPWRVPPEVPATSDIPQPRLEQQEIDLISGS